MVLTRRFTFALVLAAALVVAASYGVKPGKYLGTWEGGSASGKLEINVTGSEGQPVSADVVFTYADARIVTKLRRFAVTGQAIEIVYDFELGGATLQSSLKGELKEDRLSGTYRTTTPNGSEQVDQGSWTAKRQD